MSSVVFCGVRNLEDTREICKVWRDGRAFPTHWIDPHLHPVNVGYSWGDGSMESKALSYAILHAIFGDPVTARDFYRDFCDDVISLLPDQWVLTGEEISTWLTYTSQLARKGGR